MAQESLSPRTDANEFSVGDGTDEVVYSKFARQLESELAEAVKALERSRIAIDDWLNTYASEMCDKKRVKEALERIGEFGTLAYIADVQKQNKQALDRCRRD